LQKCDIFVRVFFGFCSGFLRDLFLKKGFSRTKPEGGWRKGGKTGDLLVYFCGKVGLPAGVIGLVEVQAGNCKRG